MPDTTTPAIVREMGLRYVSHHKPGLRRERAGDGFVYLDAEGHKIVAEETLQRIKALVIPPAWEDVWISPHENGHLQVTGRDVRGRKQYRYHTRWRQVRDESKYEKMTAFAKVLPKIRRRVQRDLRARGLPRQKVLATVVRLLETTLIRVGNDEYARSNHSYGLTTMRNRHAKVIGGGVEFHFVGKSGKKHDITLQDRRLAQIIRRCQELPGQELFGYLDAEGATHHIASGDVNAYLHEIAGEEFTAKDFRTWAGTVLAAVALREFEAFTSGHEAKKNIVAAIESVSKMLGNTPAICRKCYIHPAVLEGYLQRQTIDTLRQKADRRLDGELSSLRPEEAAVLMLLRDRLTTSARRKTRSPKSLIH